VCIKDIFMAGISPTRAVCYEFAAKVFALALIRFDERLMNGHILFPKNYIQILL